MITRLVKMTFQVDQINTFIQLFEQSKYKIRQFSGCLHLELLRDSNKATIFYTYSIWTDEDALEQYRKSEFFRTTWAQTKVLFESKPEAVSLYQVSNTDEL
ncbi:putative quinol monooxygenase [Rhodocytophaga aerolata]|uniref:Quinol monooxygenase n=1 Tax=Rhodocytophaga aerolata TaxID=455078 RepID=A0ABT8R9G7_9BACT|nr:putative quinol monooxygenase [Rhodocytophaga aerolata]MDO1448739.1 putative quinol monooxygenase [Rhodocytophaga aerolata]